MAATWGDVVSLIVISALFFGCIAAFVYVTESAKKTAACVELGSAETLELTNNNLIEQDSMLRAKGVVLTPTGVDIRLNKQAPTMDELVDAQSRALRKGGEALMRPGVVTAGAKASFVDSTGQGPSAFDAPNTNTVGDEGVRRRAHA